MKITKDSMVYINFRTEEEKEMVYDILESIGAMWSDHRKPRDVGLDRAPARVVVQKGKLMKGSRCVSMETRLDRRCAIVEARDLRNQWIAIKRGKR